MEMAGTVRSQSFQISPREDSIILSLGINLLIFCLSSHDFFSWDPGNQDF